MAGHDIIVLGASAGGVEALASLVKDLPARLPAALFVVCHFPPRIDCLCRWTGTIILRLSPSSRPVSHGCRGHKTVSFSAIQ